MEEFLRITEILGYIDLSKRRVSEEEIAKCEEKYNKSKAVHSIMRHVSGELQLLSIDIHSLIETLHKDIEELYTQYTWPLYKKFGHAYDAFKIAIT